MIQHKNSLTGYISDLQMRIDIMARGQGKPPSRSAIPRPVQALIRHEQSICILLELLEERLTRIEAALPRKDDSVFIAYAEALVFLDAVYIFTRMALDSVAGIIECLYKQYARETLPPRFKDMLNLSTKGGLPGSLNAVFSSAGNWFRQFRDRRE